MERYGECGRLDKFYILNWRGEIEHDQRGASDMDCAGERGGGRVFGCVDIRES